MKNLLFIFIFIGFSASAQFDQGNSLWIQNWKSAKIKAKKERKPILMYFSGSDWCRPCKMLQEDFFNSQKFEQYKNSFIFLYIDIPRNKDLLSKEQNIENNKLVELYNKEKSFPLINIMDDKGKVLDKISGYSSLRDTKYHFELLDKFKN
ncbi:thioredoxin family protein [Aquimarina sp. MMG016]|uniref:thioredoxin family protein n=1 Tax=Aquimarina sp. MMG016 TaxID=2822690 RepID=UPI001B3A7666|nr:thioredoxin family protein [Aquimarina sp. MMG016]MBQ4821922.1 thioredoxin family protein [Aquimarina sp. MMG016]